MTTGVTAYRQESIRRLCEKCPAAISQMPKNFTTHQFILRLARDNQALYLNALNSYKDDPHPFQVVHGLIGKYLATVRELTSVAEISQSQDIFGDTEACTMWRKMIVA